MRHILGHRLWDLYSHVYDLITSSYLKTAIKEYVKEVLSTSSEDKPLNNLLIIGIGTGECLKYIDKPIKITAIDYSPSMLKKASRKIKAHHNVSLVRMDAQKLKLDDESFEIVLMPLILAVVKESHICLKEAVRVLKPKGRLIIFDKFINRNEEPNIVKKILNIILNLFATKINLNLYKLIEGLNLRVIEERQILFFGWLKIFVLEKVK